MIIQKDGLRRKIPYTTISALLHNTYDDIKHQSQHYGGDTPLLESYRYTYQGLVLAVFQRVDPPYSTTYDTVRDMIIGLVKELELLDYVECTVDLRMVVGGRLYNVGFGILRYLNDLVGIDLNGTVSSSLNKMLLDPRIE